MPVFASYAKHFWHSHRHRQAQPSTIPSSGPTPAPKKQPTFIACPCASTPAPTGLSTALLRWAVVRAQTLGFRYLRLDCACLSPSPTRRLRALWIRTRQRPLSRPLLRLQIPIRRFESFDLERRFGTFRQPGPCRVRVGFLTWGRYSNTLKYMGLGSIDIHVIMSSYVRRLPPDPAYRICRLLFAP